jgi:hypothetical protein
MCTISGQTITNETVNINRMVHARRTLVIQHVKTSVQLLPLSNMFGQACMVLGMDWLSRHAAVIDTAQRTCAIFCEHRMAQLHAARNLSFPVQGVEFWTHECPSNLPTSYASPFCTLHWQVCSDLP